MLVLLMKQTGVDLTNECDERMGEFIRLVAGKVVYIRVKVIRTSLVSTTQSERVCDKEQEGACERK